MAIWKYKLHGIKALLDDFKEGDSSAENLHAIHAILVKNRCFREEFMGLDDFEYFEDTANHHSEEDTEAADCLLSEMYDFADDNRIWIG